MLRTRRATIAARLDRLPLSRGLWRLVLLISLGGAFELYDIFLSTYITPGLIASGMFTTNDRELLRTELGRLLHLLQLRGNVSGLRRFRLRR